MVSTIPDPANRRAAEAANVENGAEIPDVGTLATRRERLKMARKAALSRRKFRISRHRQSLAADQSKASTPASANIMTAMTASSTRQDLGERNQRAA